MAYNPGNELCRACIELKRNCEDKTKYIQESKAEYERLLKDKAYVDVKFDERTGGVKATHKDHCFDKESRKYEESVQNHLYQKGYRILLESEKGKEVGVKYCDGTLNGVSIEIATSKGNGGNNVKNKLNHCREKGAKIAVVYFPKEVHFDIIFEGIRRYNGVKGNDTMRDFESIIIINGSNINVLKRE